MITRVLKLIVTFINIKKNNLTIFGGGNYIGVNVKCVNRGKVVLHGNVTIRSSSHLYTNVPASEIVFGDGTEIGNHSTISSYNKIIFEKDVLTGPHIFISDHNHEYANPYMAICRQRVRCSEDDKVVVGEGAWIGTNAVIVGNVRIGKHSVIGANSVVTKDIPDYSVAAGIPARVIKQYNFETKCWERISKQ